MSNLQDRYINPLTDFGFKKLQERIFEKVFQSAEIAKFSPDERKAYEDSLKYYRDLNNVVNTTREEGILPVAKNMKKQGFSVEQIQMATGLSAESIRWL